MYALKARDKLHKREKEREEGYREERRARSRDQHAHHSGEPPGGGGARGGGGGARGRGGGARKKEPSTYCRDAKYMGTFSLQMGSGWKKNMSKPVKQQLSRVNPKDTAHAVDVNVSVNMDGVKVVSSDGRLVMAHALHRIMLSTAEAKKCLFAMVARNPQTDPRDGVYCHIFLMASKEQANELSQLVGKAFKTAFARNSFKRDNKKPSLLDSMPSQLPSAQPRPWSVTTPPTTSHAQPQTTPPGHTHTPHVPAISEVPPPPYNIITQPSGASATARSPADETGSLEGDLLSLHSRLHELETQQARLAGAGGHQEDALLQLVMEISALQQQIDDKGRQHALQQASGGSHGNSIASAPGATGGYHDNAMATLPDFESLSLDDAEWFQAGLPREIVIELLSQQPEGAFFVRESSTAPGSFALSLMAPEGVVKHFLIEEHDGQYCLCLANSPQQQPLFPSLPALILQHTVDRGPLPCPLSLSTSNPVFSDWEDSAVTGGGDFLDHHNYHLLD